MIPDMTKEAADLPRAEGPGDPGRFGNLLAQHAPGLAAVLRRVLKRADRVDDALQQALLQAWTARGSYDATRPFGPWLRTIAIRVARDHERADARRRDRGTPTDDVVDPAGAHEVAAEVEDEVARLRRELAHLSDTTRSVFTMFYDEERPIAAIAAALELPINTVKTHLHRARLELARRLRNPGTGA
jgi:RNA polymerase sigma-70 factor (ECF subfamily)